MVAIGSFRSLISIRLSKQVNGFKGLGSDQFRNDIQN